VKADTPDGSDAYLSGIQEMLRNVPWQPYAVAEDQADTPVKQAEQGGASLRAAELLTFAGQEVPASLQTLLASMQYPSDS